jgi:radical SAM protein
MTRRLAFDQAPLRVYWELTRACDLACRHCRAEAIPRQDPRELSTAEGRRLLEGLAAFGRPAPHVVLTGGDPLKRPDFWTLLEHGAALGLGLSVAPSATRALSREAMRRFKGAGVEAISLSLDGSDPARHDRFRGVPGCFGWTVEAGASAAAAGLPFQVNTLVTAETRDDLPAIAGTVARMGAARWSLFFLIQVGRGRALGQLAPDACEQLMGWLWERAQDAPFVLTTTEAPHYRRVALQRARAGRGAGAEAGQPAFRRGFGVRDGNGVMFVSHAGEVQPSGFLPLVAGNVRAEHPVALYRESPLFRRLREPERFGGRCGRCEFREICGGSRARAYAASGDPFGEDPLCPYQPARGRGRGTEGRGLAEVRGAPLARRRDGPRRRAGPLVDGGGPGQRGPRPRRTVRRPRRRGPGGPVRDPRAERAEPASGRGPGVGRGRGPRRADGRAGRRPARRTRRPDLGPTLVAGRCGDREPCPRAGRCPASRASRDGRRDRRGRHGAGAARRAGAERGRTRADRP